jgi:undecaprenyl diphosphate synthase
MARAEELTGDNTGMTLVIAANYGGHWDITQASQAVARKVQSGELAPSDITDDLIQQHLSIGDLPMPDLMIRTAGEQRISNFMLWHLAYTELYFSQVYWPDFREAEMELALKAYAGRKRRFGQTDDQIAVTASEQ